MASPQDKTRRTVRVASFHLNEPDLSSSFVAYEDIIIGKILGKECVRNTTLRQFRAHKKFARVAS